MKETYSTAQTQLVGDLPIPTAQKCWYGLPAAIRRESCYTCASGNVEGLVEDWLRDRLSHSSQEIFAREWDLPTVHLNFDFVAPSGMGDVLSAAVSAKSVGTSSITLNIVLSGPEGNVRVHDEVVLVLTDARKNHPYAIPDDLRKRIEPFCVVH